MAPKRNAASKSGAQTPTKDPLPSTSATTQSSTTAPSSVPSTTPSKPSLSRTKASSSESPQEIVQSIYKNYLDTTPQKTKLIDIFMLFLMTVGAVQFLYCIIAGNYPFNAFLSGFSATVGQFVLTASLRIQTNAENKGSFGGLSEERAFADFVFGSLILHFFCVNFIN